MWFLYLVYDKLGIFYIEFICKIGIRIRDIEFGYFVLLGRRNCFKKMIRY